MPVAKHLMSSLRKEYGKKRGESIYYAMENGHKGPFAPGAKYAGTPPPAPPKKSAKKR